MFQSELLLIAIVLLHVAFVASGSEILRVIATNGDAGYTGVAYWHNAFDRQGALLWMR
jgi:hypothetical protein